MKKDRYFDNLLKRVLTETLEDKADELMEKLKFNKPGSSFDYVEEGNICECGGGMYEGECMECGMREGEVMEKYDYLEEGNICECGGGMYEGECMECGMRESEIMEKLHGKQYKLDKNKNGRIDSEDFRMLRKKGEVKEKLYGKQHKIDKNKNGRIDGEDFKMLRKDKVNETLYRLKYIDDVALFTEEEIIDIIEGIINEENNIKNTPTPPGMTYYQKAHKGSGKEGDDYMKSLTKKMKENLKDGSKGDYDMNPKGFPKGNGQLEKMKAKKYTMSDEGKDFLDDFMRPGMTELVPEEIEYDEDWVKDNIKGSSRTGNNPEWANAEETDLGEKLVKRQKAKKFHKAKEMAYRKSKQPVTDGTGENSGSGVNIKLESVSVKEKEKLNEEFERIKNLMNYDKNTQ